MLSDISVEWCVASWRQVLRKAVATTTETVLYSSSKRQKQFLKTEEHSHLPAVRSSYRLL